MFHILKLLFVKELTFESQSQLGKYSCFWAVGRVGCHPKVSVFDKFGMRLKNKFSYK